MEPKKPSSKRYPPEVKKRAVELVLATFAERGERHGVISQVARKLDVSDQALRT
jgi:transposase-like protein